MRPEPGGAERVGGPFTIGAIEQRELPGQSRLYLDLLAGSPSVNEFYPNAGSRVSDLAKFVPLMLQSYSTDRGALADALMEFNQRVGSGERTIENIELLSSADSVAVVTGQQAGLFTGPAYTIYKAVSAINIAAELSRQGISAVPVFWIASEDHDLDEVSKTFVLIENGTGEVSYQPVNINSDSPVGSVVLDEGIVQAIDAMFAAIPQTAFTKEMREVVASCWQRGRNWSDAFAATIAQLFSAFGLVLFDPMQPAMRRLAADGFIAAIENADKITAAVRDRNSQLESAGYHAQVLVEDVHFPMFFIDDTGARWALQRTDVGFKLKGSGREFSREELLEIARTSPQSLSPGVLLRPVIQDMILPTAAYVGGAAEVAYFAQNSAVYDTLGRPVTSVMPRHTATVVSSRVQRAMDKLGLSFSDIVNGKGSLVLTAAELENPEMVNDFDVAENEVIEQLERLGRIAADIAQPVSDSFAKRGRKIRYHIDAMRRLALATKLEKDEAAKRRVSILQNELTPCGALQERSINFLTFLNEYGPSAIDGLIAAFDADERRHLLLRL
ncbi:MAG: bacillithiol biosynthesis cysteine-adding enzyme BshC [Acidobacteriota bacterium]|nr:MAG: bacillithiol biosynthesis cysteine-adding enzyme BshC [Acidobacteriota bacterium]